MIVNGVDEDKLVVTAFNGITGDIKVLPPRGLTESSARIGDQILKQWTFLCEDDEDCFAVGYSKLSADSAKAQVIGKHTCPAPMRFGLVPTGKSICEKLWDCGDLAMIAWKSGGYYPEPDVTGERLKGFIEGIAETITMFATPYFRIQKDVLVEMNRRWKMHTGEIPFSPTPSYRFNPPVEPYIDPKVFQEQREWLEDHRGLTAPTNLLGSLGSAKRGTVTRARRSAPKAAGKPVQEASAPMRTLSPDDERAIKQMFEKGATAEQLSELYKVGIGKIKMIVEPPVDLFSII